MATAADRNLCFFPFRTQARLRAQDLLRIFLRLAQPKNLSKEGGSGPARTPSSEIGTTRAFATLSISRNPVCSASDNTLLRLIRTHCVSTESGSMVRAQNLFPGTTQRKGAQPILQTTVQYLCGRAVSHFHSQLWDGACLERTRLKPPRTAICGIAGLTRRAPQRGAGLPDSEKGIIH